MDHHVTLFKPYPLKAGQKIRIDGSRRSGDWEVKSVNDTTVTLLCPISKKEVTWKRFCYFVEERDMPWPAED